MGMDATLLIPSTSSSLSNSPFTTPATASRSFATPVDVSLCVTVTALTSGSALSASRSTSRSIASPKGNSSVLTSAPYTLAMSVNLFPNTPIVALMTLSPGDSVFTTAASIAAVPDPVMIHTSPSVSNTRFSRSVALNSRSLYSGPLWLIIGRDISSRMSSGTGIGPGIRRFTTILQATLTRPKTGDNWPVAVQRDSSKQPIPFARFRESAQSLPRFPLIRRQAGATLI